MIYPKAFDRVWHAGVFHKLKSYGFLGQIFGLISSFLSNRQFRMVLHGKCSQEYQLIVKFLKASFSVLQFFYYILMTFLILLSVILLAILMILLSNLDVIRYLICGSNYNRSLNLNLISKRLRTGAKSGLFISMMEKLNRSNVTSGIDVKRNESFFEKKSSFKRLGLAFSFKLDWGSYIFSISETTSKKIAALIGSMKFLLLEVALYLYESTNTHV